MNDLLGLLTADNRLGEGIIMNLQKRILEAEVASKRVLVSLEATIKERAGEI